MIGGLKKQLSGNDVATLMRLGHQQTQGLLVRVPKRYYQLQRLHVQESNARNSYSGIQMTMFGGTSPLGSTLGGMLTRMGTMAVYPYRHNASIWDTRFKELKTTADLGYKTYMRLTDFTSEKEIGYTLKDSNTVISCIGSKVYTKKDKDFEDSNIRVPMAIAKAVRANKDKGKIKRFIYISAAGADPNSHSRRLRTKWLGEQEVKDICPDVTILRPTYMFNILNQNTTLAGKWGMQMKMFNRMNWMFDGMNGKIQPVFVNDVALAVLNCLKMEETIGQTYDLGGPHTYTYEEMYEQFFNQCGIKPYTSVVKLEDGYEYYHYKWWQSFYRQLFRTWLYPEFMTAEAQDLVVNPQNKGFADLYIKPVSFGQKVVEYVNDIYWLYNSQDVTKAQSAAN
jgi:NADH dehydrogenase (ubiquinone) 1 alpha subcomplex subunit 9